MIDTMVGLGVSPRNTYHRGGQKLKYHPTLVVNTVRREWNMRGIGLGKRKSDYEKYARIYMENITNHYDIVLNVHPK